MDNPIYFEISNLNGTVVTGHPKYRLRRMKRNQNITYALSLLCIKQMT